MLHTDLLCYVICTVCYILLCCMSGIIVQLSDYTQHCTAIINSDGECEETSQLIFSAQVSHSNLSLFQLRRSTPPELVMEFATAATVLMRTSLTSLTITNESARLLSTAFVHRLPLCIDCLLCAILIYFVLTFHIFHSTHQDHQVTAAKCSNTCKEEGKTGRNMVTQCDTM